MIFLTINYEKLCHHFLSERDFGRDAQRVYNCQAERSRMSPLAGTKRAAQD